MGSYVLIGGIILMLGGLFFGTKTKVNPVTNTTKNTKNALNMSILLKKNECAFRSWKY